MVKLYSVVGGNVTPLSFAAPAAVAVMATMESRSVTAAIKPRSKSEARFELVCATGAVQ